MNKICRKNTIFSVHSEQMPGFTIIEVTFALAFLSVLLITIAFLTIHITSIYQKGLSITAISSTGRELIDDFSRSISSGTSVDAAALCNGLSGEAVTRCKSDNGRNFVYQVRYASPDNLGINLRRDNASTIPVSGVFCSGNYSYLWNSGYVLNDANAQAKEYSAILDGYNDDRGTPKPFRLLKIADINRSLCAAHLPNDSSSYTYDNSVATNAPPNRTYSSSTLGSIEEVLGNSEDNLALYALDIFEPTTHSISRNSFYSGTFILATVQGGIDITSQGDYCSNAASLDLNTDFNYCAINKFNFAMRATGDNQS